MAVDGTTAIPSLKAISINYWHACGLLDDGTLVTWGTDVTQDPDAGNVLSPPTPVPGIGDVAQVAAGGVFTCALAGGTKCWGNNHFGTVGNGQTGGVVKTAASVTGLPEAIQIASGVYHACAVVGEGAVWCWGDDEYGQLGDGRSGEGAFLAQPAPVPGIRNAVQVTAGLTTSCAVLSDGTIWCWGAPGAHPGAPAPVAGVAQATTVAVGATLAFGCARLRDATVTCWGDNEAGELGRGTVGGRGLPPAAVVGLTGVSSIAAGADTACAVLDSGELRCWGDNSYGQVGNGTVGGTAPTPVPSPVRVVGLGPVAQVTAGSLITCALTIDKHVWCWGDDQLGQLGTPQPLGPIGTPVQIL